MHNDYQIAAQVSWVSILVNLLLFVGKLLAGVLAHSGAMVSDAVHSLSDILSTIVVMIGVRAAAKAPDKEHPYGHERMECVSAIVLSIMLACTGLAIGYAGVKAILSAQERAPLIPGVPALMAAIVSILVKEAMYRYTKHYANVIQSEALAADAWHHRSDALSSIGALVGIAGARMGFPVLDPLASVVICIFIVKAAFDIFLGAMHKMVDHSCGEETEQAIRSQVLSHSGVERIDLLRTREFGNRIYIELEIAVKGALPLTDAHAIAQSVHDDVEASFPQVKHIMIHVNPA